jgi:DNA polymerase III epsilon subunit-like protein
MKDQRMIVFLDTETTNLLAIEATDINNQPHIVEIYCEKTTMQFETIESYHTLIKPPIRIPENVIKIHGIDNEAVTKQYPFAGYYQPLARFFVGVTHIVGHNLQYDKRMMIYELQRINKQFSFPWPIYNICTVEEIFKIKGHRMSLGDLHFELFGTRFESAHSAEADTKALIRVYKAMVERRMVKGPSI